MEADLKRISYLMRMIGKRRSTSSFESLEPVNMAEKLSLMLKHLPIADDTYLSDTTDAQVEVETQIRQIYESLVDSGATGFVASKDIELELHLKYIEGYLNHPLPLPYVALDVNHTWMIYWLVNAYVILSGKAVAPELRARVVTKIKSLVVDNGYGGISGGPNGQIGHVASTYAAVLALILVEDYETLGSLREGLYLYFLSMKQPDGSFCMHAGGELDARSTYCVVVVSSVLNILTPQLSEKSAAWLCSCQTYEGGFAGVPFTEAHGGYTFCALAALFLLQDVENVEVDLLIRWLAARQQHLEGGFSGRTNKLVDACYSFWIGASMSMMETVTKCRSLFDRAGLACYIQNCCQNTHSGGFIDKPGKHPDFYHTNYTLCGMATAEHELTSEKMTGYDFVAHEVNEGSTITLAVNPVFGLPLGYAERCRDHFIDS